MPGGGGEGGIRRVLGLPAGARPFAPFYLFALFPRQRPRSPFPCSSQAWFSGWCRPLLLASPAPLAALGASALGGASLVALWAAGGFVAAAWGRTDAAVCADAVSARALGELVHNEVEKREREGGALRLVTLDAAMRDEVLRSVWGEQGGGEGDTGGETKAERLQSSRDEDAKGCPPCAPHFSLVPSCPPCAPLSALAPSCPPCAPHSALAPSCPPLSTLAPSCPPLSVRTPGPTQPATPSLLPAARRLHTLWETAAASLLSVSRQRQGPPSSDNGRSSSLPPAPASRLASLRARVGAPPAPPVRSLPRRGASAAAARALELWGAAQKARETEGGVAGRPGAMRP